MRTLTACPRKQCSAIRLSILLVRNSQLAPQSYPTFNLDTGEDLFFHKIATVPPALNHLPLWKKARTVSTRQTIRGFPTFMLRRPGGARSRWNRSLVDVSFYILDGTERIPRRRPSQSRTRRSLIVDRSIVGIIVGENDLSDTV